MSLVRLLTTGKSLVGLQDTGVRYQMRRKHLLPRFGSVKNPFSAAAAEPAPGAAAEPGKIPRYRLSPGELAAARMKETKRLPVATAADPAPAKEYRAAAAWRVWGARMKQALPVGWLHRQKAEKAPAVRSAREPVQAEFSLASVKVVRNDLSDADVEVVPARTAVKHEPNPALVPDAGKELVVSR